MGKREKKFNKWLIGAVIGGAVLSLGGLSMTPKGKSLRKRLSRSFKKRSHFFLGGRQEMKKVLKK